MLDAGHARARGRRYPRACTAVDRGRRVRVATSRRAFVERALAAPRRFLVVRAELRSPTSATSTESASPTPTPPRPVFPSVVPSALWAPYPFWSVSWRALQVERMLDASHASGPPPLAASFKRNCYSCRYARGRLASPIAPGAPVDWSPPATSPRRARALAGAVPGCHAVEVRVHPCRPASSPGIEDGGRRFREPHAARRDVTRWSRAAPASTSRPHELKLGRSSARARARRSRGPVCRRLPIDDFVATELVPTSADRLGGSGLLLIPCRAAVRRRRLPSQRWRPRSRFLPCWPTS